MALKGSIKEFGLSEIFQLIFHQKKEGLLHLIKDQQTFSVCFKDGKIIRAYEGDHDKTLGDCLTKANILSADQLIISRYKQENANKSLEAVLVDLELVLPEELKRLNRLFTEETIFKVFDWKAGEYEFEQKDISFNPMLVQPLDTQFILMEAVRQIDEWPLLLKKIVSRKSVFEQTDPVGRSSNTKKATKDTKEAAEDFFGDLGENIEDEEAEEEDWLLNQIDGRQTVQEIIDRAQMGAFYVYQGLTELLANKVIREKKEARIPEEALEPVSGFSSASKEKLLKALAGVLISTLVVGLFIFSMPSLKMTTLKASRSFEDLVSLSEHNQRYFIRFALDLYYLKYNRYPESLQGLMEEGFFGNKQQNLQNLNAYWTYKLETGNADKFILQPKDLK